MNLNSVFDLILFVKFCLGFGTELCFEKTLVQASHVLNVNMCQYFQRDLGFFMSRSIHVRLVVKIIFA